MPLIKGFSAASFQKNVRTLRKEGRESRQCIAIAYKEAREALTKTNKRETKKLREAWKVAIAKGLKGTSEASKKVARRARKIAGGAKLTRAQKRAENRRKHAAAKQAASKKARPHRWHAPKAPEKPARASSSGKLPALKDMRTSKTTTKYPTIAGFRAQPRDKAYWNSIRYFFLKPKFVENLPLRGTAIIEQGGRFYTGTIEPRVGVFATHAHNGKIHSFSSAAKLREANRRSNEWTD